MLNFIGPSYALSTRKADTQRSVNLFPQTVESASGKSNVILKQIEGLVVNRVLEASPIRGAGEQNDRAFFVAGSTLYELTQTAAINRGTLLSTNVPVSMAFGISQLVLTDGPWGYVLDLVTNVFTRIINEAFYGSPRVDYLNGRFYFTRPDTGQFYASEIEDALNYDPLYFATAERSPDSIVGHVVDHSEVLFFGKNSVEVWSPADTGDNIPLLLNESAVIEVGTVAAFSIQRMNGSVFWLGRDRNGSLGVYQMNGYQPQRVSTVAVEEALARSSDLSATTAYTYQRSGAAFYCMRVPGCPTTMCFNAADGKWHDRAELVDGNYLPHRGLWHIFAWNKHLLAGDDGTVYEMRDDVSNNAGDVLVRDRISPHAARPDFEPVIFPSFEVDVTSGEAPSGVDPVVVMRYSNDGGATWGSWQERRIGAMGQYNQRVRWLRQGQARDRVFMVRFTANAPFSIVGAQ